MTERPFVLFQSNSCFQENVTIFDLTPTEDPEIEWSKNAIKTIRWCFLPLIIVGIITNIINIMVFSKTKMRSISTGNLLLMLAFADLSMVIFQVRYSFSLIAKQ